jgi:hypothetical protein
MTEYPPAFVELVEALLPRSQTPFGNALAEATPLPIISGCRTDVGGASCSNRIAPTIAFPNGVWERGKVIMIATLVLALSMPDLFALSVKPFPPDTIIYHVVSATLKSVSSIKLDEETREDRITVKFIGEWQINSELHGANIKPQAGVIIGADTPERKRRLEELRSLSSSFIGKKVDIYIYGGSVNKDRATYTWPELIKIIPTR